MENEKVVVTEPTEVWIEEKKKAFGKIFKMVIDGNIYVYRMLTRPEYRELQKTIKAEMTETGPVLTAEQSNELEESVAKLCVLWPENYSNDLVAAGIPSILATCISDVSGYKVDQAPVAL